MAVVVHSTVIGLDIAAAERRETVHMMGMPVAEVLDFRVPTFDPAKNSFLVRAVLKTADARSLRLRSGFYDAGHLHCKLAAVFLVRPDKTAAGLVVIEEVALVENDLQVGFRQDYADVRAKIRGRFAFSFQGQSARSPLHQTFSSSAHNAYTRLRSFRRSAVNASAVPEESGLSHRARSAYETP